MKHMQIQIAVTKVNKYAVSESLVNSLLTHAVSLDDNHPEDDISVMALKVSHQQGDNVQCMSARPPIHAA